MNQHITKLLLIACCCYFAQPVLALHIIGGEMTYKCLGNGDYEIEMRVYRDTTGGGARFDSPAFISIYRCGSNLDCSSLDQGDQNVLFQVPLLSEETVLPNDLLCLEGDPPGVKEGLYRFKLSDFGISLDQSTDSYFIVYQRCCRNVGINNIRNADDGGSTYYVEITPEAQRNCNSSPVFNNFPDLVICQNFELQFDHSATDPDGDSLVYYFAKPLDGGGNDTRIMPNSCTGSTPIPPCPPITNGPPFYRELNYIRPLFDETFPLGRSDDGGINTTVTIDSMTGIISGVPSIAGLFVVTVVIEEYRDSVLLSTIRRDFQYTVGACVRNIEAIVVADELIGDKAYRSTICQQNNVLFEHASTPAFAVGDIRWEFDLGNDQNFVSTRDEAVVTFPNTGIFEGTLIVNPGSRNCEDRATITVDVFPETIADFSFEYDTCAAGPVSFVNESTTLSAGIQEISWNFGDGMFYNADNINFFFPTSGNLPVTLTVTDVNDCAATKSDFVAYFPLEPELFIAPSASLACTPASITFDNLDTLVSDEYDITWDFGDGNGSTSVSPTHVYENPGIYTINLDIKNPFDCRTTEEFPSLIQVTPSPIADFTFTPEELTIVNSTANFIDNSISAITWDWNFNDIATSNEINPIFTFPDTGFQMVQLIVTHLNGCTDTTSQLIDIFPSGELFMPNAFTPNGDGQNDIFIPVALLFGSNDYSFTIWNRWGERVFFSDDIHTGWNGTKNNSGKPSSPGVYLYLIEYTDTRGSKRQQKGFATLVR